MAVGHTSAVPLRGKKKVSAGMRFVQAGQNAEGADRLRNALVIGGLGFLGGNLSQALLDRQTQVTILAPSVKRHERSADDLEKQGAAILEGDIRDATVMMRAVKAQDVIFNLAGHSGTLRSMEDPWTDLDVNCRGNLVLLEAVRTENPSAKVVFAGSRLQYGRPVSLPVHEEQPMAPLCIHAVHKVAAEQYFSLYHRLYDLRTTVLRITNPYGPGQPAERSGYGIVNRFIHLALAGQPLPIYGDGSQIRDYLFVDDLTAALLQVGCMQASDGQVYNLGSGKGVRLVDMAKLIIAAAGSGRLQFMPWHPMAERVETGDFVADISKISRATGWHPRVTIEEGLARTVKACRV